MTERTAVSQSMADHIERIAHHDIMIENLAGRMGGVEMGLKSLDAAVQKGFSDIGKALAQFEGSKGPGIGRVMSYVATGGAIITMTAGAITMLVTSLLSPEITKIRTLTEQHHVALDQIDKDQRDEYRAMKTALERANRDRVQKLEERLGWGAGLKVNKD